MRIIDLFCGCGGLSKGFELSGHSIVAAYDYWPLAIETYNLNFLSHKAEALDISNIDNALSKISKLTFNAIIGGPPCQDFSSAGNREEGLRADLTLSFAKIICAATPEFFVMENVARSRNSAAYARARKYFKKSNYGLTEIILDASKCGVPQARKRFFSIGHLNANDDFLKDFIERRQSKTAMTVRDYMGNELDIEHYYRHPRNYNRRAIFSVDEPAATIRGVNRPIPEGYKGHGRDSAKICTNVRSLTTHERSRIQTFPASFQWVGSKTDIEQMIGNAVPVNLGKFVGDCLLAYQASIAKNTSLRGTAIKSVIKVRKKVA